MAKAELAARTYVGRIYKCGEVTMDCERQVSNVIACLSSVLFAFILQYKQMYLISFQALSNGKFSATPDHSTPNPIPT